MNYLLLVLLHFAIAFLIYLFRPLSFLYTLGIFAYFSFLILRTRNRNHEALLAAAYLAGAEILLRMTGGLVFYETGKYGLAAFLVLGMFFIGASSKAKLYWGYLLLLFPGVLVASQALEAGAFGKAVAFNLSGPVCLGICAIYCYFTKISSRQLEKVLLMLLLPIITTLAYLFLYTPPLSETETGMSANFLASGGFGPNQMATLLGMGMFLLLVRILRNKSYLLGLLDLGLLGMMSFRALATFSRGGVLTALVCSGIFCFLLYRRSDPGERRMLGLKFSFLSAMLLLSVLLVSSQTNGLLLNRYTNTDLYGNYRGNFTTGRMEILATELASFYLHPLTGVGVGVSAEFRKQSTGNPSASHNEISRLLAEHGMLGFFALLLLLLGPLVFWLRFKSSSLALAFLAFWLCTINHSATRTALPAVAYGLALLYISDEKKNSIPG